MICSFDDMLIYEYLDDLLEPDEKMLVSNHLSVCPECRKKIAEIKLLYYELEHLKTVEIPLELSVIRTDVVEQAFKESNSAYNTVVGRLKKTKLTLNQTPVIGVLMPTKDKLSTVTKVLYKSSKKMVQSFPKKEKPKKKKLLKNLGGLL